MADEVERDHVERVGQRHHVLRIGFDMPADAVHQEQRFGIALAGFRDADGAEAGLHIADLRAE
ncbi:hypothetical protein D3C72_2459640 [compost metagenome]